MSDAVNRALAQREALDTGFSGSLVLSVIAHAFLMLTALMAPFIFPKPPPLQVQDGFVVPLPRGGGGAPGPAAPAPPPPAAQLPPAPQPEPPAAEPPPKILKPPKDEPRRRGLPELDAKRSRKKPTPPPRTSAAAGATGASSATPGLEFGPPGPGVPGGTDLFGDWYLAGVQRKIWLIWTQQLQTGFSQPIRVTFTIVADGTIEDVRVVEASPVTLLNLAAQRAVVSAGPFGPLPRHYGTNRLTIQALFKPAQ